MASAVQSEEDEARLAREAGNNGSDGEDGECSSSDDDDEGDIDVEGGGGSGGGSDSEAGVGSGSGGGGDSDSGGIGTAEEREKRRLVAHNLAPAEGREKEGDVEVAAAGGERLRSRRKRAETLGERVLNATSQCQACLYDIAMVPCKVGAWRRRFHSGKSSSTSPVDRATVGRYLVARASESSPRTRSSVVRNVPLFALSAYLFIGYGPNDTCAFRRNALVR